MKDETAAHSTRPEKDLIFFFSALSLQSTESGLSSPLGSTRCQNQVTNPKDGSVIISESKNAVRVKNRICESVDGKGWLDDIHGLTVISNIMLQRKIRNVDGCRWSCHASFFVLACSQPKVDRIRDQAGWLRSCQTPSLARRDTEDATPRDMFVGDLGTDRDKAQL